MSFYCCIAFDLIGLIHATKEQNKMEHFIYCFSCLKMFVFLFVHCCLFGKFTFYFEISLLRHSIVLTLLFMSLFFPLHYPGVLFQEMDQMIAAFVGLL